MKKIRLLVLPLLAASFLTSCNDSSMTKHTVQLTIENYIEYLRIDTSLVFVNGTYASSYYYRQEVVSTLHVENYMYNDCHLTYTRQGQSDPAKEILLGKNGWFLLSSSSNTTYTYIIEAVNGTLEYWF